MFSLTTYTTSTGELILSLSGRFAFNANQKFRESYKKLDAEKLNNLTVDLFDVSYVDSSALGMLLILRDHVSSLGGNKVRLIINEKSAVHEVLFTSKFDELFHIVGKRNE